MARAKPSIGQQLRMEKIRTLVQSFQVRKPLIAIQGWEIGHTSPITKQFTGHGSQVHASCGVFSTGSCSSQGQ
jgi:hypothetical protein